MVARKLWPAALRRVREAVVIRQKHLTAKAQRTQRGVRKERLFLLIEMLVKEHSAE
jgi:hypothetical protein